jgi:hypothetical protein
MEDLTNVDRALEDFYEEDILTASRETRINEERIRRWCQEQLITSSGTRSTIHRGIDSTSGINNKVVDILESNYLIRRESRSAASWYELTQIYFCLLYSVDL